MADRRQVKSPYTEDRLIPGAFEGETVTRRRFMVGSVHAAGVAAAAAFTLPALGFALGPIFHRSRISWQDVGPLTDFTGHDLRAARDHAHARHRGGRQEHRVHPQAQPRDRRQGQGPVRQLRGDLHQVHAPRLSGALDRGRAALRVPVSRRRLRLPGQAHRRAARAAARPLLHPCGQRPARARPALQRQQRAAPLLAARPGRATRRDRQYLYPRRFDTTNKPPGGEELMPKPPRARHRAASPSPTPGRGRRRRQDAARRITPPRPAPTSSTGSTSARRSAGCLRWLMFRKVPKGTNWFYTLGSATLFAFLSQAITGVFLAMYYDPSPIHAYESVAHITNEVFLGQFVRGMHKWGATRDDGPDLPAHGQDVLLRRLQVPAGAELGDRRGAARADDGDGADRLPAAVRPALLLGHDRGRQHQRHGSAGRARTWRTSSAPGRSSARRRCRASMRSTCCCARG